MRLEWLSEEFIFIGIFIARPLLQWPLMTNEIKMIYPGAKALTFRSHVGRRCLRLCFASIYRIPLLCGNGNMVTCTVCNIQCTCAGCPTRLGQIENTIYIYYLSNACSARRGIYFKWNLYDEPSKSANVEERCNARSPAVCHWGTTIIYFSMNNPKKWSWPQRIPDTLPFRPHHWFQWEKVSDERPTKRDGFNLTIIFNVSNRFGRWEWTITLDICGPNEFCNSSLWFSEKWVIQFSLQHTRWQSRTMSASRHEYAEIRVNSFIIILLHGLMSSAHIHPLSRCHYYKIIMCYEALFVWCALSLSVWCCVVTKSWLI